MSFFDTNDVGGLVGSNSGRIIASLCPRPASREGLHIFALVGWNHAGIYASCALGQRIRSRQGRRIRCESIEREFHPAIWRWHQRRNRRQLTPRAMYPWYGQIGGLAGNAAGIITASYCLFSVSTGSERYDRLHLRVPERKWQIQDRRAGVTLRCIVVLPAMTTVSLGHADLGSGQQLSRHRHDKQRPEAAYRLYRHLR